MTAMPEARLAREAEMCYATLAMATDYDSWHPDHDSVTVDLVVQQPEQERTARQGHRGRPDRLSCLIHTNFQRQRPAKRYHDPTRPCSD